MSKTSLAFSIELHSESHLTIFDDNRFPFRSARLDLIATAKIEYFNLLTTDVKFFVRKYLRDYRTGAVLALSVKYRQIAEVWPVPSLLFTMT